MTRLEVIESVLDRYASELDCETFDLLAGLPSAIERALCEWDAQR